MTQRSTLTEPCPLRLAYADPPYLGCCGRYGHPDQDGCWDEPETHRELIESLIGFDGWALSCTSTSLRTLLPMCPPDVRVAAWVKPFAAFKRNVRNAYTWEPVILRGGRVSSETGAPVTRDHLSEPITLKRGLVGAKSPAFCRWVLAMLGYLPGDVVVDIFPGTGVMGDVLAQGRLAV